MKPGGYSVSPPLLEATARFFGGSARLCDLATITEVGRTLRERQRARRRAAWDDASRPSAGDGGDPIAAALEGWARLAPPPPLPALLEEVQILVDGATVRLREDGDTPPLPCHREGEALMVMPPAGEIGPTLGRIDAALGRAGAGPAQTLMEVGLAHARLLVLRPLTSHNLHAAWALSMTTLSHRGLNPGGLLALGPLLSPPADATEALDAAVWTDDAGLWLTAYVALVADEVEALIDEGRALAQDTVIRQVEEGRRLNDRQHRAIAHIRQTGRITNREYRRLFGVSNRTAHVELSELVARHLVRRVGFGRGVEYV